MAPASHEQLARALSELYLATARAQEGGEDRQAVITLYTRELRAYPGDIVLAHLRGWRGTFFPALTDLKTAIETDDTRRDRILRIQAIREHITGAKPEKKIVTAEEAEAIRAKFGTFNGRDKPAQPKLTPEQIENIRRVDGAHGAQAIGIRPNSFRPVGALAAGAVRLEGKQ